MAKGSDFTKFLIELFLIFAKIGVFTFGGGYAMFPVIKRELIENRKWITEDELLDYYAIGQCTPGIIAVNVATFVGKKLKGFWGALLATLGVIFPSIIIILIIAGCINNFADLWYVQSAFSGIRVVVIVLILNTIISMWKKSVQKPFDYIVFLLALLLSYFNIISSVLIVLASGVAGIFYTTGRKDINGGGQK